MSADFSEQRRLISEVVALHRFEPELLVLYVEGRTDKVFFEHLLDGIVAHVYEIDSVHIPADVVAECGADNGAKGRVIALSIALEEALPDVDPPVRCIVDTDMDTVLGKKKTDAKYLRYTDHSCVESYAWNEATLKKYLSLGLHGALGLDAPTVMATLEPVLEELFLMRATNLASGRNMSWVSVSSCVTYKRRRFTFDRDGLWRRWLQANDCWRDGPTLELIAEELRSQTSDYAHVDLMHGHDLTELLSILVRESVRPAALGNQEVVSRMLLLSIERGQAHSFPLLRELMDGYASQDFVGVE
ncbi:hypothetical protein [Streptomyces sp. NPDC001635]